MPKFMTHTGVGEPPGQDPAAPLGAHPEQLATMRAATDTFLAHRSALAFADRIGTPAAEFPGDHVGFETHPNQCAQVLDQLLIHPT